MQVKRAPVEHLLAPGSILKADQEKETLCSLIHVNLYSTLIRCVAHRANNVR